MAAQARNLGLILATASLSLLIVLTQNIKHVYHIYLVCAITSKHNKKMTICIAQKVTANRDWQKGRCTKYLHS